jgi:DUF4097 and DUF4098 domain-containing protein YvlB
MHKTIAALVLLVATAAAGAELQETFDRTLNVRPGTSFSLDNVNGPVLVSGWDQPRVRIHAVKKVESRDDSAASDAMKSLRIEVKQTDRAIEVETIYPRKGDLGFIDALFGMHVNSNVTYEIQVPRNMNVAVDNVNGSVTLKDISGEAELETTNGKIEVSNCSGNVDASTTNGGINVELLAVTPGKSMTFDTTNGRIALSVPPTLAAEVNAATTNGAVSSEIPLATSKFSRTSLRGTLNGGGPEIRMRTTNGGITIKSATRSL